MVTKIIAGGQTGVDQAALQAAIDLGIQHSGWCPPGRISEAGSIPEQFKLTETPSSCDPSAPEVPRSQRTIWNVRDSDGLLIFCEGTRSRRNLLRQAQDPGTILAINTARKLDKTYLIVDVTEVFDLNEIKRWISKTKIQVLSVGGPSEKTSPGIYLKSYRLMMELLSSK